MPPSTNGETQIMPGCVGQGAPRRKNFVTIATGDFAAQSRILAQSARRHHSDARLVVLAVDTNGIRPVFGDAYDLVVSVEELPLSWVAEMRTRYSIAELSFALKPWIIAFLLDKFPAEPVYYFDSDIEVFSPLAEVDVALTGGANLVLTPHILQPLDQESEEALLRSGTLNAGFLVVAPTAQGRQFVSWWGKRLRTGCTIEGTCGDQKWLELVTSICDGVVILRHPGYNFAFWNAHERPLGRDVGGWTAAGRPLRFVHYTKWNLRDQNSEQYLATYFGHEYRQLGGLFADYQCKVRAEGEGDSSWLPATRDDRPAASVRPFPHLARTVYKPGPSKPVCDIGPARPSAERESVTALVGERDRGEQLLARTDAGVAAGRPHPPVLPDATAMVVPWRTSRLGAGDLAARWSNGERGAIEWLEFMNIGRAGERRDAGIYAKPGQSGHVLYGPYVRLSAGDYRVRVRLSAGPPLRTVPRGQPVAAIEAVSRYGKTYLAQRQLPVMDCARSEHELLFRVGGAPGLSSPIEVRVWTSGVVPLTVSSITVERVGAPAAAAVAAHEAVGN